MEKFKTKPKTYIWCKRGRLPWALLQFYSWPPCGKDAFCMIKEYKFGKISGCIWRAFWKSSHPAASKTKAHTQMHTGYTLFLHT